MTNTLYNRVPLIAAAITACAISACSESKTTEPNPTTTYVLRSINGRALPTPRYTATPTDTVIADTLILDYSRNIATDKVTHHTATGSVTVVNELPMVPVNGGVTINFGCPANALCVAIVAPSYGTIQGPYLEFVDGASQDHLSFFNPSYPIY